MPKRTPAKKRSNAGEGGEVVRDVVRLSVTAAKEVTTVVEDMHRTIASGPGLLGSPFALPATLATRLAYGSVRGAIDLVGAATDRALARLAPWLKESHPGPEQELFLAVLNGVVGDYLEAHHPSLAISMQLRHGGVTLSLNRPALRAALPRATGRLLVLIHGSSMSDLQWKQNGHDHGAALARSLGLSPIYLRYNSGLHVSTNGRALDALLEELVDAWPVRVERLVLLGHSMGGLIARAACHEGELAARRWRRALASLVCLGTPHQGAPLERGGSWVQALLGVSRYSASLARLARLRSAGVTDLRYGAVRDEDWRGRDRFALAKDSRRRLPLPEGVKCYAVAGTTATKSKPSLRELPGDGLVPVDSALGRHVDPALDLGFPVSHQWIAYRTGHVQMLGAPNVYRRVRGWLA